MRTKLQLVIYVINGGIQFLLDLGIYSLLTVFMGAPVIGNLISRAVATVFGFILNSRFTFQTHQAPGQSGMVLRYCVAWLLITALTTAALALVKHASGIDVHDERYIAAKALVEVAAFVLNFCLSKFWVFVPTASEVADA